MRTSLIELGHRDGWECWLCGGAVDPDEPAGSLWAASVDHVVPRSLRGPDTAANRRLAHRRCNSSRGNRVPELAWPRDLPTVDAVPLFDALSGLEPGHTATVALVIDTAAAERTRAFVVERASLVLGGGWEAWARRDASWWTVQVRRVS